MRFYLSIYFGWEYESPIHFCEKGERPFFRIFGSLPYSSLHPFLCGLSPCFDANWPSLTFLSLWFLLSLFYYSISLYLIWFISFLILLDVWLGFNIHTLLLLIWYVIDLLSFFLWGSLNPRFMMFSTHCISCMKGMGIISLGLLSLVFFRFFHPKTLAYVTFRVRRPPWGHDFTYCVWRRTHGQYLRLVGDYFLEHDGRGAMIWFTLGHTPLISDGFSEVMWPTLGHTALIDDSFFGVMPHTRA